MKKLMGIIAILILMTLAIPGARAETTIAVLDMQMILSDSDAAKSILDQIKAKRENLGKEIEKLETALKKDEQTLIKEKESKKPEEFAKSRKEFEKKLIDGRGKVQKMRKDIDASFNTAINELRDHILKVTAKIAETKKIQLVMTKQNVVIGDKDLDITADVMTALNTDIKAIKLK